jgi:hypothetical protein
MVPFLPNALRNLIWRYGVFDKIGNHFQHNNNSDIDAVGGREPSNVNFFDSRDGDTLQYNNCCAACRQVEKVLSAECYYLYCAIYAAIKFTLS